MRELLEQDFEVAVVKDATAAPKHPEWGYGYQAALNNYAFLAHAVLTTDEDLNGGNRTTKNRLVPFCMYTDPEVVRVGRNESEARRDGIEYRLAKMPMAEALRTTSTSEPRGFLKMLIGTKSDEILGFTAFGFEASELLAAVQTAMIGRLPYTSLRDAIFTHPTVSEGLIGLLGRVEGRKISESRATA